MEQLDNIQDLIHVIRGQRVMLDFDLARLYHVETKTLNQAVKRNAKRFEGEEFMFQLTKEEWREVKVKITNINIVDNQDITTLRSQNVTARQVQKQRFQPYAFTEIGVAMLSSVLRSEVAIYANRKILANHVAELYGVETREVNQAIKNNPNKFPNGYILELDKREKDEVIKIFDNLGNLLYSPAPLKAFTEKGLYMLATILKSPKAVETTIAIVEAYAKLRELTRVMSAGNERDSTARGRQASTGVAAEAGRPIGGRPAQRRDAGAKQRNHPGTQTHRQAREAGKHVDAKIPL